MSVYPGGNISQAPPQIDFGVIGRAWELFKAQAGAWVGAAAVLFGISLLVDVPAAFLTGFAGRYIAILRASQDHGSPSDTLSLMSGLFRSEALFILITSLVGIVLAGGAYRMALKAARGERVAVGDVLSGFGAALPLIGVGLITLLCAFIGGMLCFLPGLIVGGLFMFAPLLVVDRKLGPVQAISESIALLKSQWLMATAFYFVATLLAGLSVYACGVGALVGLPVFVLSIALTYLALTEPRPQAIDYGQAAPGVWPPPPGAEPPAGNWPPPSV